MLTKMSHNLMCYIYKPSKPFFSLSSIPVLKVLINAISSFICLSFCAITLLSTDTTSFCLLSSSLLSNIFISSTIYPQIIFYYPIVIYRITEYRLLFVHTLDFLIISYGFISSLMQMCCHLFNLVSSISELTF